MSSNRALRVGLRLVHALAIALMCGCGSDPGKTSDAGASDAALDDGQVDASDDGGASEDAGDGGAEDAGDASMPPLPPTDVGEACDTSNQCSRQFCLDLPGGYCSAPCQHSADCGEGNFCHGGQCFVGCPEPGARCGRDDYFCSTLGYDVDLDTWQRACDIGMTLGGAVNLRDGLTLVVTDPTGGTISLTETGVFTLPHLIGFDTDYHVTFEVQGNAAGLTCVGEGLTGRAYRDVTSVWIDCGPQATFTEPGTHAWVVPAGVTSVSVVVVGSGGLGAGNYGGGGGELCYQNGITVTPGATMQVVVGDLGSGAMDGHDSRFGTLVAHGGANAMSVPPKDGLVPGGTGGTVGTCFAGGAGAGNSSSGGAAGYAGVGGRAWYGGPALNGAGGGGGGGAFAVPGGGVGLEGIGADGIAPGGNGSQPMDVIPVAGGGGTTYNNTPQRGQHGGVRIIWGAGRSYPSHAEYQ